LGFRNDPGLNEKMDQITKTAGNLSHHDRLKALQAELTRLALDGFVVAHTDEHKSEYTPEYAQRLAWLTGFDGSAGQAVVMRGKAAIFVDGRYTLQVRAQVDAADYEFLHLIDNPPRDWIIAQAENGSRIGYDPWLHTITWVEEMTVALARKGADLIAVEVNPIDTIWADQPTPSTRPAVPHPLEFAGVTSIEKRKMLAAKIKELDANAAVFTALDSIAWLFNIRGADVQHTPVVLAFAILQADGTADLFIDPRKVTPDVKAHLGPDVRLHPKSDFENGLKALGNAVKTVLVDAASASSAVFNILKQSGAPIKRQGDLCQLPKALKNIAELEGARAAHHRDGAALTRYLHWVAVNGPRGDIDEITASDQLENFRRESNLLKDLSFGTISGAGPNGAIVHYSATPETARKIEAGQLYLVDSGGQYQDGTTDVTRTVAIGQPGAEEKDRFTRVLRGHIAIATARFPKGTTGAQLDALARMPLWQAGFTYDHGTGHGVGSYLSVHEGPQGISKNYTGAALEPGMIVSNEPGYYKANAYGIRIENLLAVRQATEIKGDIPVYEFEVLTLAPIDRNLIDRALLTEAEADWLNRYHARVYAEISPQVDAATAAWLKDATAPI
jgi:Xaa-Pro aminopeptidase